jgi:hypothetical protein
MGGVQLPKKGKRGLLSFVFSTAKNGIHDFGRVPVSVGIVDRNEGYVN